MENFISANNIELLYENEDTLPYIHYNGSTTNPEHSVTNHIILGNSKRLNGINIEENLIKKV
jgi:hypothetical protein